MARSYKFAVLRVTPDPRRGETVNIGLIIFADRKCDVRVLPNLSKLQNLDGTVDISSVFALEDKIPEFVSTANSIEEQVELLSDLGFIRSSDLGEFVAHNEAAYDRMVGDLMNQLVKPKRRTFSRARETRIASDLRKKLATRNLLGDSIKDIDRHLVVPHFPISEQLELYADFALKNGVMNLVQTIDLRAKNAPSAEKFRQACTISFGFVKAAEEFSGMKKYVVYAAEKATLPSVERHMNVLSEDADHVLNYESPADRQFLLSALESAATGQSYLA